MPDDPLFEIASSVADGNAVDWDRAEHDADDDATRDQIRALRAIAEIGDVHRSLSGDFAAASDATTLDSGAPARSSSKATPPLAAADPLVPDGVRTGVQWQRLTIRETLGEGAFGTVLRAYDATLDREVALKLLRTQSTARARAAVREGRLLARVKHPNVVTVYGAEQDGDDVGIWMELIDGQTLASIVEQQGPFGAREATLIGIDLCRALAAVHEAGIAHRDVKAQNVMREDGGRIVLTDFGVGRDLGALTDREDTLSGTPLYLAPELFEGQAGGVQADIYSLGVLLYYLASGDFPVRGRSIEALRNAHENRDHVLLRDRRPKTPSAFARCVERALEVDPDDRYSSAGAFGSALERALQAQTTGVHTVDALASDSTKWGGAQKKKWPPRIAAAIVAVLIAWVALVAVDEHRKKARALALYQEAREAHESSKLEPAIHLLQEALALDPELSEGWADLSTYLHGAHRFNEALVATEKALETSHRLPTLDRLEVEAIGKRYFRQDAEAERLLSRALDLGGDGDTARLLSMTRYRLLHPSSQIIEAAERAVALAPDDAINVGWLIMSLTVSDQTDRARFELDSARQRLGDLGYFYWCEGMIHMMDDRFDDASHSFETMRTKSPLLESHGTLMLARAAAADGDLTSAAQLLESGITHDRDRGYDGNLVWRYIFLASLAAERGDDTQANAWVDKVPPLPTSPNFLLQLRRMGILHARLGNTGRARTLAGRLNELAKIYPSRASTSSAVLVEASIAIRREAYGTAYELTREAAQERTDWATLRLLAASQLSRDESAARTIAQLEAQRGTIFLEDFPTEAMNNKQKGTQEDDR